MNSEMKKRMVEIAPRDLHFRSECEGFHCGALKSWEEGFAARDELVEEEIAELKTKLVVAINQRNVWIAMVDKYEGSKLYDFRVQNANEALIQIGKK